MLQTYRDEMRLDDFRTFLAKKRAVRQVDSDGPDAFFEPTMLAYVERTWENWLGPLVADLPSFDLVVTELPPGSLRPTRNLETPPHSPLTPARQRHSVYLPPHGERRE